MERWGRVVHRHRLWVLAVCLVLLAISVVFLVRGGDLQNSNSFNFESDQASQIESQQLAGAAGRSFTLLMGSDSLNVTQVAYKDAVVKALAPLRADPAVMVVTVPALAPAAPDDPQVSPDGHWILVTVGLRDSDFYTASDKYPALRDEVSSPVLQVHALGELPLNSAYDTLAFQDLRHSGGISLVLTLIVLLLVFGSVIASALPLLVGSFAVLGGLGVTLALSHVTTVSPFATEIVGLVGLGVGIDYSLFIVSRFREELRAGAGTEEALATTMATAGRAIIFSGVTVAIGLLALTFYQGTFLVSLGFSGAAVVGISVLYALTLLPAVLSLSGPNVNRLRLPLLRRSTEGHGGFWRSLANGVMRRPVAVLVPCIAFLLLAGSPFPQLHLATSNVNQLPASSDIAQGAALEDRHFPLQSENTVDVVIQFQSGGPFTAQNIASAYDLAQRLRSTPGVSHVTGYVALDGGPQSAAQYAAYYSGGTAGLTPPVRTLVQQTTGSEIAVLRAATPYAVASDDARNLVKEIRAHDQVTGASVRVTGETAFDVDFVGFMLDRTPSAVVFVMIVTFLVLLLLLRSLVLPLKAVLMNLLSLSAAFGAMVFIFQQGHLSGLLDFTAAPIDPTLPILLFCIVFGLSMDYEVFLLTRMQEAYREHGDNRRAVAEGLEASGRLVTGAAAIMICVFSAFALASLVVIKSIGLGMAVAVFVDATIVRALVVPAIMRLLGKANWWAPRWLRWGLPPQEPPAAAA